MVSSRKAINPEPVRVCIFAIVDAHGKSATDRSLLHDSPPPGRAPEPRAASRAAGKLAQHPVNLDKRFSALHNFSGGDFGVPNRVDDKLVEAIISLIQIHLEFGDLYSSPSVGY